VVRVEQWAEIRRMHFVRGLSIKEIARRTGRDRNTIRKALRSDRPPRYVRPPRGSKLEPFREEIHRLLGEEPRLPGVRLRELLGELGYEGGKTILDDYLRELRPLFLPRPRSFQRTSYRPGALCQFDLWEPSREIPVGGGQTRRGYVVVACLPYSRAGAGALAGTLVWDREGALHAGGGRPSPAFAAFCGQLRVGWHFCGPGDPEAKGAVERLQGYAESNFEPGRRFANERDFQAQLDGWFEKANARVHRTLRCRPIDRLIEERAAMAAVPAVMPDVDRRWVTRVAPDPYLRVDTNDYSLDPRLVGRRVEVRVAQTEIVAVALERGELACRHQRSFARHRTITALEHARALRDDRDQRNEPGVEVRSLDVYDRLIA
jgi:transposase